LRAKKRKGSNVARGKDLGESPRRVLKGLKRIKKGTLREGTGKDTTNLGLGEGSWNGEGFEDCHHFSKAD